MVIGRPPSRLFRLQDSLQLAVSTLFVIGLQTFQALGPWISRTRPIFFVAARQQKTGLGIVGIAIQHGTETLRGCWKIAPLPKSVADIELVGQIALVPFQGPLEVAQGIAKILARFG